MSADDFTGTAAEWKATLESLAPRLREAYATCSAPESERVAFVLDLPEGLVCGVEHRATVATFLGTLGYRSAAKTCMRPKPGGGIWIACARGDVVHFIGVQVVSLRSRGSA